MALITRMARLGKHEQLRLIIRSCLTGSVAVLATELPCNYRHQQLMQQQHQRRGFASQAGGSNSAKHSDGNSGISEIPASVVAPVTVPAAVEDALSCSSSSSSTDQGRSAASTAASSNDGDEDSKSFGLVSPALLTQVSSALNRLTGYESIDNIKAGVGLTDRQLQEVKRALQTAKGEYDAQLAKQNQLHREVTALLQRKSSWVPADVARFTELYAAEHQTEQAVASAKARYSQLSDDAEQLQLKLVDLIRERYQQEQLWSDKIRRASTWWTWGLMGLHFASFVVVYTFLEPRKRAALQAAVADMLNRHMTTLDTKITQLAPTAAGAAAAAAQGGGSSTGMTNASTAAQEQPQSQQLVATAAADQSAHQDLQQVVLQELQSLRQQLNTMQQALPAASAAGAAATSALQAACDQQQQVQSRWRLPGIGWASAQVAAAGRSAQMLWQHTKQQTERVVEQYRAGRDEVMQAKQASSRHSSHQSNQTMLLQQPAAVTSVHRTEHDLNSLQHEKQAQLTQPPSQAAQQQDQPENSVTTASGSPHRPIDKTAAALITGTPTETTHSTAVRQKCTSLMPQLRSDNAVLEVTRGQLAVVAMGASAAGAALTAMVMLILRSSGGAAGG